MLCVPRLYLDVPTVDQVAPQTLVSEGPLKCTLLYVMIIAAELENGAVDPDKSLPHSPPCQNGHDPAETRQQAKGGPVGLLFKALACYPVSLQIARHLDLNGIADLSITCRDVHELLLHYRPQLIKQTLRCSNERQDLGPRLADRMREYQQTCRANASARITSGTVGLCAHDMVGECRRCGITVCRNCTVKAPPSKALSDRHRRLCKTCIKAPLDCHISVVLDDELRTKPDLGFRHLSLLSDKASHDKKPFTHEAFSRGPCLCPNAVYLCMACGSALRSADVTYMRGWTWRTRYSTYLGGLGTGIGEGNEGVECGKVDGCLAAREVEKEIDCDADELAEMKRDMEKVEYEGRSWEGSSYLAQEIEGIGRVMKKKVKKRVKVGQVVKEYEDERESGDYMGRERKGLNRSWCAWCSRIIPSTKDRDLDLLGGELTRQQTNSSASSVRSFSHD